jgi:hypothetical protein
MDCQELRVLIGSNTEVVSDALSNISDSLDLIAAQQEKSFELLAAGLNNIADAMRDSIKVADAIRESTLRRWGPKAPVRDGGMNPVTS